MKPRHIIFSLCFSITVSQGGSHMHRHAHTDQLPKHIIKKSQITTHTHRGRVTSFSAPVYIFIGKNQLPLHYIRLLILTYRTFNRNLIILGPNCRFHEKNQKSQKSVILHCVRNFSFYISIFPPDISLSQTPQCHALLLWRVFSCVCRLPPWCMEVNKIVKQLDAHTSCPFFITLLCF